MRELEYAGEVSVLRSRHKAVGLAALSDTAAELELRFEAATKVWRDRPARERFATHPLGVPPGSAIVW
jgi:hypothetical protein